MELVQDVVSVMAALCKRIHLHSAQHTRLTGHNMQP